MGLVYWTFARYNTALLYFFLHPEMFSQQGTFWPGVCLGFTRCSNIHSKENVAGAH